VLRKKLAVLMPLALMALLMMAASVLPAFAQGLVEQGLNKALNMLIRSAPSQD
jgi:hypothetical protein